MAKAVSLVLLEGMYLTESSKAENDRQNQPPIQSTPGLFTITLDGRSRGRAYQGEGAVSAGASSRLLIDYPEPQRGHILDYLFKPNFGASIQHLKVEIGGDVNSTDGCEPSHMHTRDDYNCSRGYEWWLMVEARKRNPNILLDTLSWGAPGWIGDGRYYSQDMADYVVKFLQGAKRFHGLDIDYTGCWNERPYNAEWLKLLRKTLNENGLDHVKISAPDNFDWSIINAMERDPSLRSAVYAVGEHYMNSQSTKTARDSGIPLWSSEDTGGHDRGIWKEALNTARLFNHNYILGRMTKTEIWSLITSYYSILPAPNSGIMTADTPWSGHYVVPPTVWAVAHTTQFAQPGWLYLDDEGCALLQGIGSYVTLLASNNRDFSIILETGETDSEHELKFDLVGGLSSGAIHVWHSDYSEQFNHIMDIHPRGGSFTIQVKGHSVYSLTTTAGQRKGSVKIPLDRPFPKDYRDDFSKYPIGGMARYFSDQAGIFEVVRRSDGKGNALRQIMTHSGIEWMGEFDPYTVMGDSRWQSCEVSVDAMIEKSGYVALYGHIMQVNWNGDAPEAVWLTANEAGDWQLHAGNHMLKSGRVPYSADTWHNLRLRFNGDLVIATIDGRSIIETTEAAFPFGLVGFGSGWNNAQFANFSIRYDELPTDLALHQRAASSSDWSKDYAACCAVDGNMATRWNSADGTSAGEWIEIDFGKPTQFNRVIITQFDTRILKYKIQYSTGGHWKDAFAGGPMRPVESVTFPAVTALKMRLLVERTKDGITPSIYEIEAYDIRPRKMGRF